MDARVFAEELRRQCSRFASIAQVCEGVGINRQQFNKYLSGSMLPSARTLRRICDFLHVSEEDLLSGKTRSTLTQDEGVTVQSTRSAQFSPLETAVARALKELSHLTKGTVRAGVGTLPLGYYYCYFPLHHSQTIRLRTLLSLKERDGQIFFTRRTYIPALEGERRFMAKSKHRGVVVTGLTEAYLIGMDRLSPHNLSHISINIEPDIHNSFFSGLAVTTKRKGPIATNVLIQHLGSNPNVRELLRKIGPINLMDPKLDPVVRLLMSPRKTVGGNQLHVVDIDELIQEPSDVAWRYPDRVAV